MRAPLVRPLSRGLGEIFMSAGRAEQLVGVLNVIRGCRLAISLFNPRQICGRLIVSIKSRQEFWWRKLSIYHPVA